MQRLTRGKVAIVGAAVAVALLALTAGTLFAQSETPVPGATPTADHMEMMGTPEAGAVATGEMHATMHGMMDAMHGPGTSGRMHEAMGPQSEQMMEQCAAMMGMMGGMGMEDMEGMEGMPMATPEQ